MKITKDIQYVGVNDHQIDLFEGQYSVPNGMAYNSYVILDEKIAVMDTVDARFGEEWLGKIRTLLGEKTPDYLIVQHMEPDHSANLCAFMAAYPQATVVASEKAFPMMKQFFGDDYAERRLAVRSGDVLALGTHTLHFVAAPMVHWPEVIVTYDEADGVLFSADGFGKFGALDADEDWACEARRYYFGIVGKYGAQVQKLLAEASALDIRMICPLHGPILSENLSYYLNLYHTWSSYAPENEGVTVAYTSVYGNTKKAAECVVQELQKAGFAKVELHDLARCDMAEAVEDAFRYSHLVLATTTYNGEIFPFMRNFLEELKERGYRNRKIGLIENGTWAPLAAGKMRKMLETCRDLTFAEHTVTIRSGLSEENKAQLAALAEEMCAL